MNLFFLIILFYSCFSVLNGYAYNPWKHQDSGIKCPNAYDPVSNPDGYHKVYQLSGIKLYYPGVQTGLLQVSKPNCWMSGDIDFFKTNSVPLSYVRFGYWYQTSSTSHAEMLNTPTITPQPYWRDIWCVKCVICPYDNLENYDHYSSPPWYVPASDLKAGEEVCKFQQVFNWGETYDYYGRVKSSYQSNHGHVCVNCEKCKHLGVPSKIVTGYDSIKYVCKEPYFLADWDTTGNWGMSEFSFHDFYFNYHKNWATKYTEPFEEPISSMDDDYRMRYMDNDFGLDTTSKVATTVYHPLQQFCVECRKCDDGYTKTYYDPADEKKLCPEGMHVDDYYEVKTVHEVRKKIPHVGCVKCVYDTFYATSNTASNTISTTKLYNLG